MQSRSWWQNILRDLIEEAVEMLGEKEMANNTPVPTKLPRLEVDGRDEKLAQDILESLAFKMEIAPELVCWGGVVVRSGDGRIIVANTLEARFERLKPHLGMFMPSFKLIG
jgi:vacuolar-type H+-ATPase subunit E/Vma4